MIGEDVTHALPQIMEIIRREGIDIIIVNIKKPSMDDVFVHYTGHDLREGDENEKQKGIEIMGGSE
jgi:ABC-2 type transport system ATP-binding protein